MRSLDGLAQIWRGEQSRDYTPLTLTSFWLEWRLWDDAPTGYHVVNILLHALCALLLWRVLERLPVPGAWLGALLFAIHPVNVASVAWVAERKNTLSFAFFLGSVLCYLAGRDGKRRALYLGSIGLFLLAALSKGAVVAMPAVLLLCVLWKDRKIAWRDSGRSSPTPSSPSPPRCSPSATRRAPSITDCFRIPSITGSRAPAPPSGFTWARSSGLPG